MKFTEDKGDARYRITGYGDHWIAVNEERITQSFILTPQGLLTAWPPQCLQELTPDHLQPLFATPAEVILIGSGTHQQLPSPHVWQALVQHGCGFEIMTTPAACRTYTVLTAENRPVTAAFFLLDVSQP